ncbi:MAG: rRNA maturation RNase YbeY [Pyrinomonadaceae bacterium]
MDVVNLQRKIKLDLVSVRAFVTDLSRSIAEAENKTFSVAFVSDRRMKQLNEMFRGLDSTTDVLSFPHEPDDFAGSTDFSRQPPEGGTPSAIFLGDIVISAEQAQKQAAENGLELDGEIKQLILHGLLHLCGYDHETDNGEMNKRELKLRKELGI